MGQDVLSSKPVSEVIEEASRFFTQRRLKVIEKTNSSLRFALSEGHEGEAGQVKVVRESAGETRVYVDTGGLTVWHVAEAYLRELRKQFRSTGRALRRRRAVGSTKLRAASLGSLGDALGMNVTRPEKIKRKRSVAKKVAKPMREDMVNIDDLVAPPPKVG